MLIQILSTGRDFPKSPYPFKETYRFHFSDIEDNHPRAEVEGITDRQAAEIARVLASPAVRDRLMAEGLEPKSNSPEEMTSYVRAEYERWGKVVKAARLNPE